jgi:uncharacterized protein with PIN domain
MRFLVDGMLGGLARWLRILGYEARYDASAMDNNLLTIASEENMVLLTRDKELHQRAVAKKIVSVLVVGETEEERLAQMARAFGLRLETNMAETRCPECGARLIEKSKSDLADKALEESLKIHNQFWKCANQGCGKVYWVGSHWKQIRQTLEEAAKLSRSKQ